ncbi:hypothetical protein [Streptomyces lavenduligriseus]|uniref:Uncharacterized protein n=1 Tax=Streptomyces lavenduligriseus TaxID=67315 RepID=A0ABT0P684_9ACTN|nr:hypothetical protein [Streptomyces lavenduligriseus]MCL3999066.1 hypothetical protein [Streptomyces lavenduligriseus]
MFQSTIASAAGLRAEIDFESEYVLHVREDGVWTRPKDAEHRALHGIDVWHAIRRSPHYGANVHVFESGVLVLASSTATLRFIPADTYEEYFCSEEDRDDYSADGEGLCGNCAGRAYAVECAGEENSDLNAAPLPPSEPAVLPTTS